jgi:hypothetical protein
MREKGERWYLVGTGRGMTCESGMNRSLGRATAVAGLPTPPSVQPHSLLSSPTPQLHGYRMQMVLQPQAELLVGLHYVKCAAS